MDKQITLIAQARALYAALVRAELVARATGNRGGEYRLYFARERAATRCTRRSLALEHMMAEAVN